MSNIIDRLGGSIDSLPGGDHFSSWTGELSPGEMQIISFLRLLYHCQPPFSGNFVGSSWTHAKSPRKNNFQ